jgi:hypothetical protein
MHAFKSIGDFSKARLSLMLASLTNKRVMLIFLESLNRLLLLHPDLKKDGCV